MVLRKPYAFFIKYFKIIHVILTLLSSYLMYKTTLVIVYLNEFTKSGDIKTLPNTAAKLFSFFMFFAPFLIIIISIMVLSLLFLKEKPLKFYIFNIISYLTIIFLYNFVFRTIGEMETTVLHPRTIRIIHDFMIIIFVLEFATTIRTLIYSTGFDIKKFNFGEDLAELEIAEEDREEFEVGLEIDVNKAHRDVRRRYRFSKYVYVENKFLINMITLILISFISFIIYFNNTVYNKTYKENVAFTTKDFSMRINKSYITQNNYKNVLVSSDNTSLLVLEIQLKKHSIFKKVLDESRTQLVIKKRKFYHLNMYRDSMVDLGKSYEGNEIKPEFTRYILIYEIPNTLLNEKKLFKYLDEVNYLKGELRPKYINVRLKPKSLDDMPLVKNYKLDNVIDLKGSVLNDTKVNLTKYEINDYFKVDYEFCVSPDECYNSYEYVKPNLKNREHITLLKLNGKVEWDESLAINPITNVYKFLNLFGSIEYVIDGKKRIQSVIPSEVRPSKVRKTNEYYMEVDREIINADKINLIISIRNKKYIYELK